MFAKTTGSTIWGLNGRLITVEVDIANGIPALDIVGLPDTAVKESRERVRAAIKNSGLDFPAKRITVNLAPADIKKDGSGLDLPIAVGILAASHQLDLKENTDYVYIGELSLDGEIRGISGILPILLTCRAEEKTRIMLSPDNAQEALLTDQLSIYTPKNLEQLVRHLKGEAFIDPLPKNGNVRQEESSFIDDFSEVHGQIIAKRALEIAAAGAHNLLMSGPPGAGKTMLARRIASILPSMSQEEALEVTKIFSVAGMLKNTNSLLVSRPFRHPHHTISAAGMIGGGSIPRPGEVTLAHNGILFLDELPEFPRQVLEVLRQPLEDGFVTISRVNASFTYPSSFMMLASMNPCPCGFLGDAQHTCSCTPNEVRRYLKKISGPLLDRIDLHVHVPKLEYTDITSTQPSEPSAVIRKRVEVARQIQAQRFKHMPIHANAQMKHREVKQYCLLTAGAQTLMKDAFQQLRLSARGYDKILKVARTIADLAGSPSIEAPHVAEAIQFRSSQHIIEQ